MKPRRRGAGATTAPQSAAGFFLKKQHISDTLILELGHRDEENHH
jgi:hypothetical protein